MMMMMMITTRKKKHQRNSNIVLTKHDDDDDDDTKNQKNGFRAMEKFDFMQFFFFCLIWCQILQTKKKPNEYKKYKCGKYTRIMALGTNVCVCVLLVGTLVMGKKILQTKYIIFA